MTAASVRRYFLIFFISDRWTQKRVQNSKTLNFHTAISEISEYWIVVAPIYFEFTELTGSYQMKARLQHIRFCSTSSRSTQSLRGQISKHCSGRNSGSSQDSREWFTYCMQKYKRILFLQEPSIQSPQKKGAGW